MRNETLESGLQTIFRELLTNINTAFVGIVVSFDGKNKISVQPAVMFQPIGGEEQPLPVLEDVPLVFPGGSSLKITWTPLPGDEVLVVCAQRSIDNWKAAGGLAPPGNKRRFSASDAVAIPGLESFAAPSSVGSNPKITSSTGNAIEFTPTSVTINGHLEVLL
jgi:hypothetical protein